MRRIPTWLALVFAALGLIFLVPGLWVFVSLTAKPLYPNPESVPTLANAAPSAQWAAAVEQGRRIARRAVAEQNLPGLSVAVGIGGELVWAEGFGFADLKHSAPVTPDHRFRIGTASTALTGAAAGLLLENGRLKLDDEIQTYVPAFPKKQWPVTLRALMEHTAGITADGGDEGPLFTKHCERPVDAVQTFAARPLLFQPGTQYRYSSYGWILVSAAVEAAADRPLLRFMRERIFAPLGMRDTVADGATIEAGEDFPLANLIRELIHDPQATRDSASTIKAGRDVVTSYFPRFAADPSYGMHLMRPLDYSCYSGASVFVSTPSDLVRFGMAMNGGTLLQPGTVALLQTPERTVVLGGKPTRVVAHNGDSLGGRVASLLLFPEYGMVVAVASNISYADTAGMGERIAEVFVK